MPFIHSSSLPLFIPFIQDLTGFQFFMQRNCRNRTLTGNTKCLLHVRQFLWLCCPVPLLLPWRKNIFRAPSFPLSYFVGCSCFSFCTFSVWGISQDWKYVRFTSFGYGRLLIFDLEHPSLPRTVVLVFILFIFVWCFRFIVGNENLVGSFCVALCSSFKLCSWRCVHFWCGICIWLCVVGLVWFGNWLCTCVAGSKVQPWPTDICSLPLHTWPDLKPTNWNSGSLPPVAPLPDSQVTGCLHMSYRLCGT